MAMQEYSYSDQGWPAPPSFNHSEPAWRCLTHGTRQWTGEQCKGIARGLCSSCGCWKGEHYAAQTFAGDTITGCSGTESGGAYGEYNVPCRCAGFQGNASASVALCEHEDG
jgi:hypothetical protein